MQIKHYANRFQVFHQMQTHLSCIRTYIKSLFLRYDIYRFIPLHYSNGRFDYELAVHLCNLATTTAYENWNKMRRSQTRNKNMHKIFSFTLNLKNDLILKHCCVWRMCMASMLKIWKNKGTRNDGDIIFEEKLFAILNSREICDLWHLKKLR